MHGDWVAVEFLASPAGSSATEGILRDISRGCWGLGLLTPCQPGLISAAPWRVRTWTELFSTEGYGSSHEKHQWGLAILRVGFFSPQPCWSVTHSDISSYWNCVPHSLAGNPAQASGRFRYCHRETLIPARYDVSAPDHSVPRQNIP